MRRRALMAWNFQPSSDVSNAGGRRLPGGACVRLQGTEL